MMPLSPSVSFPEVVLLPYPAPNGEDRAFLCRKRYWTIYFHKSGKKL